MNALFLIILLLLLSPLIVAGIFFYLTSVGISFLDISLDLGILILLLVVIGSFFNIPLGKRGMVRVTQKSFFGVIRRAIWKPQGVSINVGGALIPLLIVGYFFPQLPLKALFITTLVVAFFSFLGAQYIKEKGIVISMIVPTIFSAFFAVMLGGGHATEIAFSAGVLGVLIGAYLLYIPSILRKSGGVMSIGGAGVFDGIFLVGVFSALLASL